MTLDSLKEKPFDKPLEVDEVFKKYFDEGPQSTDKEKESFEFTKLLVEHKKIISISELEKNLNYWAKKFNLTIEPELIIKSVFSKTEIFENIKKIAFEHGQNKKEIIFDRGQHIETAFWLMGRYHIKRIELTGDLIVFNEMYYDKNAEELITRHARKCLVKSSNADMKEIIGLIKDKSDVIKSNTIERDCHLKCLLNGIYDIKIGQFTPTFNPDYIILNQLPHNFIGECVSNGAFTAIDTTVKEIIPDDNDRQSYYDILSISMHPYTGIDKQLGLVGPPGTGKTQICKLTEMVLGSENVSHAPIHLIARDTTTQNDIMFKFLNIDADLGNTDIKQIDVIKKWITQDKFTGRSIYSHSVTGRPTSRLFFCANELYEVSNDDDAEAIYERTRLIIVDQKFRNAENEIKNVFEKVSTPEQLDNFVTYLLRNATEIYGLEDIHSPQTPIKVKEIWDQFGNRIRDFTERYLIRKAGKKVEKSKVWFTWQQYAIENKTPIKTKNAFYDKFELINKVEGVKARDDDFPEQTIYVYQGFEINDEVKLKV